jgi:phytoene dehydrogenase-like protein
MYDVVVIGAGHNGLVCAAYLARAGRKVAVLERRPEVGGAVCTKSDLLPGCRIDVGSSVHIMIHLTPILRELRLCEDFGLQYIEMDPWAHYPVLGTDQGISFYRDVERTCASIAAFSPADAERYRAFVRHWTELNAGVFETFLQPPTPGRLFWTMFKRNLRAAGSRKLWSSLDTSRQLMAPYGQLIRETFENEHLRSAMLWLAAQSGPGPDEVAAGDMFGWNAMIHTCGAWRAKGGSGALSESLAACLRAHGGEIFTNHPVTRLHPAPGGWEIETSGRTFSSRKVVSACHIHTLFGQLLESPPEELRRRVLRTRIGNGFGMIVRHHVAELPHYGPGPAPSPSTPLAYHSAMQLLCPNEDYLRSSFRDFSFGLPPREPSVVAMTFSAIDPTLAPPGTHLLFTWGQYFPYQLSNGEHWDAIREREADKLYDLVCRYAPNMRGKLLGRYIQTPPDIERLHGLLRANVMHLEMSLDQMFMFRPLPELSAYTTPLPGLYLTGSSTHPGGGVFGASGRNTARVILAGK